MNELIVWTHGRRSCPGFVIKIGRRGSVRRVLLGSHVVVTADLGVCDISEQAGVDDPFFRLDQMGSTATLRSHLHDPCGTPRRVHHRLTFENIDSGRFLNVDVRASFDGRNHGQRMPMVGGRDQDDIQLMVCQQFVVVGVGLGTPL